MEQDECWFDIAQSDEGICLLGNSKEQIFVEKLVSLLRHGYTKHSVQGPL